MGCHDNVVIFHRVCVKLAVYSFSHLCCCLFSFETIRTRSFSARAKCFGFKERALIVPSILGSNCVLRSLVQKGYICRPLFFALRFNSRLLSKFFQRICVQLELKLF